MYAAQAVAQAAHPASLLDAALAALLDSLPACWRSIVACCAQLPSKGKLPDCVQQDLEIIFSRFGTVTSCDIIRDYKTGDSLNYAFLGFDSERACEEAYFKMNNCLIDDRRIKARHPFYKSSRAAQM